MKLIKASEMSQSMRYVICMSIFVFSSCSVKKTAGVSSISMNPWINKTWKVDTSPFETKEVASYSFFSHNPVNIDDHFGYFITFHETTFTTNYQARCGNDCFTSVLGEYEFKDSAHVHIRVNKIERGEYCSKLSEDANTDYGVFHVTQTDQGWKLQREMH